ncbi:MAG TPA: tRNA (N6-isopentenyl adenosine(37)-C2)-methylthiotransferase MiaB [Candidatus Moranbacteria bacterium]|nr:tRNA (N6-isopentenyl adenosine(37)-C2)-methylthiotransferase MiaB [Candidatus Moranbacteria bacterium]HRZ34070.1 tRNA (N6-isopentenyl adenosine(37)-C2)-methylthiotransferase MiaB [Candidatus Moranbacteria bacterium]
MPKYHIKTFGCAMNVSDSERIASFLEKQGFILAKKTELADLVVFNTCGIRQTAENRAYGMIHDLRKKHKDTKIILTGCLANRKDVQIRMKKVVDLFTEIKDFPKNFSKKQMNYLCIKPKHTNKFQAYVPIMTGCNKFCSYCVVPYARGREISRPAKEIEKEVQALIKKGYKHIILLGQNVNSYKDDGINFSKLLKKINTIPGNFWISFVSSHPKDFSNELIETIAKCKKVCEWVHLPIQSGNDKILERMNRRYTQKHYLGLIKKIRLAFKKYKPDSLYSISSDIIVGFPGETKKQFMDSAEVAQKAKFDMVFFGQFSPRPETVAWKIKDNVSKKEKVRREKILNEILKKTATENNKKYVGRKIDILIEKQINNIYFGKTRTMKNVKIKSKIKNLVGKIVKAKITKANIWNLEASF